MVSTVWGQFTENLQHCYKPGAYITFTYRIAGKNHVIKLSTSSDLLLQKTCQVKNCKRYKITKICLRCGKYLSGECTFDNKTICEKCSKVE